MSNRNRHLRLLAWVGLAASCSDASAEGFFDALRSYNLNDFALGIAYSWSQSEYALSDDSGFPYPYLTSFRNPAFTDDWLLLNNGDLGVRWVSEGGWVLGAVGRIQTTGTGNVDLEDLIGLEPRHWTVEVAPLVGWRGWPIHLEFKLYHEIFNRHGGRTGEFRLSYPTEYRWGYLVPSIAAIRLDQDYTQYYYGVDLPESSPVRLSYAPGAALNYQARLNWGYAINDRWLLSGHVTSEWLDDQISSSPIVDKDQVWSATIGIAYNADIFQSRDFDDYLRRLPRFEIRVGAFRSTSDSRIIRRPSGGGPGEEIDLEEILGATEEKTVLQLDALIRFGPFHRLELGHFRLGRDTMAVLKTDLEVGNEIFPEGTAIDLRAETRVTRAAYGFSLMNDAQKELGVMAGVHVTRLEAELIARETGQQAKSSLSTPLPVIGVYGTVAVGKQSTLDAVVHVFRMNFDNYSGSLNYINFVLQRKFTQRIAAGIGYNYYSLNLDSNDPEINGSLRIVHDGPLIFLTTRF